jgi:hypothetical protein
MTKALGQKTTSETLMDEGAWMKKKFKQKIN